MVALPPRKRESRTKPFFGRNDVSPPGDAAITCSHMKRRSEVSMARKRKLQGDEYRSLRMKWGLSSRLPRWRTFDGRRSQLAPSWARSEPPRAR